MQRSNPRKQRNKNLPAENCDQCKEVELNICFKRDWNVLELWNLHNIHFKDFTCIKEQILCSLLLKASRCWFLNMIYWSRPSWMSLPHIYSQVQIVHEFSSFLSSTDQFCSIQFQMPSASRCNLWNKACCKIEIPREEKERKGKKEIWGWLQIAEGLFR